MDSRKEGAGVKCIQSLFLVVTMSLSTSTFSQNIRERYVTPFEGPILKDAFKADTILLCSSNLAGSTGIYPESQGHQIISEFSKQTKPAVWHLAIEKEKAICTDNQGNQQTMMTTKFS